MHHFGNSVCQPTIPTPWFKHHFWTFYEKRFFRKHNFEKKKLLSYTLLSYTQPYTHSSRNSLRARFSSPPSRKQAGRLRVIHGSLNIREGEGTKIGFPPLEINYVTVAGFMWFIMSRYYPKHVLKINDVTFAPYNMSRYFPETCFENKLCHVCIIMSRYWQP